MIRIQPDEFKVFSQFVYTLTGISLDETKTYLIENRLASLMESTQSATFSELYFKAKMDKVLQKKVIDAMTTRETLFFRDGAPFELLQFKIIPELIDRRKKAAGSSSAPIPIRVWSAACSTGQELYSIAIALKEVLVDLSRYDIKLVGTDIADAAVAAASKGIFGRIEIERGLPPDKLARYFTQDGDGWKIRDELRGLATFRHLNLMEEFSMLGKFDIVFCRNVAIYFSEQDRTKLFTRIARVMEPDGSLLIGSTESLTGICPLFESKRYLRSVYYQLKQMV